MYMHHRDRELVVLKVELGERMKEFDGVFMNQWRKKYGGNMPVSMFGKFIQARGEERAKIEKELGIYGEDYQSL
jgi:hypothetical protein